MKNKFYIDYPQENFEGQATRYRCTLCKEETTKVNGRLEGHLSACEYRVKIESQNVAVEAGLLDAEDLD
ncbi:MAG: hypothetical protein V3U89_08005 [Methylophilaceae bacterium]